MADFGSIGLRRRWIRGESKYRRCRSIMRWRGRFAATSGRDDLMRRPVLVREEPVGETLRGRKRVVAVVQGAEQGKAPQIGLGITHRLAGHWSTDLVVD